MKRFDAERHEREANRDGRSFEIGGEELVARSSVSPDVWVDYYDRRLNNRTADRPMTNREYLDFLDDHVRATLEPESVPVWERVRKEAEPPITLGDIDGVIDYLWEIQSGRPTGSAAESSPGSATEETGTTSTDASSQEQEAVSTV